MAYDLVIRGGLVATATDAVVADLGIRGGRIATIDQGLPPNGQEIDARGLVVMPGGVDVHTHLDLDLGGTRTADDFESGTAAAACGGVTTICDYAWQQKGVSAARTIETWKAKAQGKAHVDYGFHVILSEATEAVLKEIPALVAQGIGLWIGMQAIINIGVNTGMLPTKGLTLPLVSFGGTALVATCCALAVLLRVDWENRQLARGFTV